MVVLFLVLILSTWLTPNASAQRKYPVGLKLEPMSIRGRSAGAIPIRIKLEYNSNQLLEGDLVMHVYNSVQSPNDLMATIRHEGIVLQGTDYIFTTVLPPFEHSFNKQYLVESWFETQSGRIPLSPDDENPREPRELLSIGSFERATLICSCSGDKDFQRLSPNRRFLNQALMLDNYNPLTQQAVSTANQKSPLDTQRIQTYAAGWDAYDLPEDPLRLCCFDIVLLADQALGRLDEAQMKALTTWVEAGGSLCILPDDKRLTTSHLNFLQTLFERPDDADLHFSLADDGTLLVISSEDQPVVNRHHGLGRVTLLPGASNLESRLSVSELGSIVGHLWKVHADSPVFQGQPWKLQDVRQTLTQQGYKVTGNDRRGYDVQPQNANGYNQYGRQQQHFPDVESLAMAYGLGYELQPAASALSSACEISLMPNDVEIVPAWVIGVLLIAYVITIGPVDYLVLGLFRVRKYTWVLFPLVTAAFTGLTIVIAHHYMASTDTGGQLTVVDLVEDGRPVRQTDFRLAFHGRQTTVTNEVSQSFLVLAQMNVGSDRPYNSSTQSARSINTNMLYTGRFPNSFSATQQIRQWEPQTTRSLTFDPDATTIPSIPWNRQDLIKTAEGRSILTKELNLLRAEYGDVDAIVLHRSERFPLFSNGFLFSQSNLLQGHEWMTANQWNRRYMEPPRDAAMAIGLLDASARQSTRDFFSIVSQVSPQGSAPLEDLPVLDVTDGRQWLLIVAARQGDRTQVYRRLYVEETP
ncbi:MAG: hypothetical protein R3C59_01965 [Planctomycetaceae bacterium]